MTEASANNRVAVLGTYRSGTSAVAGGLHFLGVDMGQPYYGDHFESIDLCQALQRWWCEPKFVRSMSSESQVLYLRSWIESKSHRRLSQPYSPAIQRTSYRMLFYPLSSGSMKYV